MCFRFGIYFYFLFYGIITLVISLNFVCYISKRYILHEQVVFWRITCLHKPTKQTLSSNVRFLVKNIHDSQLWYVVSVLLILLWQRFYFYTHSICFLDNFVRINKEHLKIERIKKDMLYSLENRLCLSDSRQ